jgi:hypothetical protein
MTIFADEIRELLCRQLHYINSGKVKFLIYRGGAGGEFLAIKIPRYSSDNYMTSGWTSNNKNRYISGHNIFGEYMIYRTYENMKIQDYIEDYINNLNLANPSEIHFFRKLDNHLSNGGMFFSRSHKFFPEFMNSSNTYYLHPDNKEMKDYLINLRNIKLSEFGDSHSYLDEYKSSLDPYNLNIIKMSEMFNYGYLENIFNIKGKEFHEELMEYYERNLLLISSYT